MKGIFASNKILAPPLHATILYRSAVIRNLIEAISPIPSSQALPYKLVLLCAPAGYGKTLLLADAVRHTSIPCCWYFLGHQDTDPALFLQYLLASMRQCFPAFGFYLDDLLSENTERLSLEHALSLMDALLNALDAEISDPFLLAFCNYHEVNRNPIINHLTNHLLAHLPPQGALIIESRVMPALELASLIARRQMFGLGSQRLRFTAQEVHELAHLQGITTMTLQQAEQIVLSFDGWIAGILLGSSLGYSYLPPQTGLHSDRGSQSTLHSDHQPILAYIANEIFVHETVTYEFLKEISILDKPTVNTCNALLEITDAEQRLIYAEQQGLFLTHMKEPGSRATIYLCHPILRELLLEELRIRSPERYLALNNRAVSLFLAEQAYEQALTHALQVQDYSLASTILTEIANAYVARKGTKTMRDWLSRFPEEVLNNDPRLLLILADIHDVSGERQQLTPLLDTVEALLNKQSSEDVYALSLAWAELSILRANLLFSEREFHTARELCQKALTLLPPDQRLLRIKALQSLGVGMIFGTGEISQGIVHLQHALQLSKPQQEEAQIAVLHRQLGTAYTRLGNYTLAEHHQKRALSIWEQMDNPRGIVYSLIAMGQLKRCQGFTQEAEDLLIRALHLTREPHQFKSGEAFAFEGLGELACDRGQYAQALLYLEDSLNIALSLKDTYLFHCDLCHLATVHALMDDAHTAQFLLNQVEIKEQEERSYEGLLHCLAQGTIFLAQQVYDQAQQILEHTVLLAQQGSLQRLHIIALLKLTLCSLKEGKRRKALQLVKQVLELNKRSDHDHTIQVEMNRFPELQLLLDQVSGKEKVGKKILEVEFPHPEEIPLSQNRQGSSRLRILALGEPQVFSNEIPITRWRMARAMELYFFLLENDRPLRKQQIMVALWPDGESERIDQIVRSTIYYLRKAIGEDCLEYTSGLYRLNLSRLYEDQIWYDVAVFDTCYREAKKALEQEDDETAFAAFSRMIELYKGDYLQPFYSDWCIFRRDQLRQTYIDTRHQMALICWRREDFEASLQHWQHVIALDTCFEKAHYGIMRYYLHQGKRELALRQYQRCCRTLQEELHATPGSAIQKLYHRILGESSP